MNDNMRTGLFFLIVPSLFLIVALLVPGSNTFEGTGTEVQMNLDSDLYSVEVDPPGDFTIVTDNQTDIYDGTETVVFQIPDEGVVFESDTTSTFTVINVNDENRSTMGVLAGLQVYSMIAGLSYMVGFALIIGGLFQGGTGPGAVKHQKVDFEQQLQAMGKREAHQYFWQKPVGQGMIAAAVIILFASGWWFMQASETITVLAP